MKGARQGQRVDLRRARVGRRRAAAAGDPGRAQGQPGTKEFRVALRDALEGVNAAGAHGIFNMSASDHLGLDQRAAVMIQIVDGKWVMQK